jgi:hypothetical protein
MSNEFIIYNPDDIINKKARGSEKDNHLGIIKEVNEEYIIAQQQSTIINGIYIIKFYIPKDLLYHFDRDSVYFKITKQELKYLEKESKTIKRIQ